MKTTNNQQSYGQMVIAVLENELREAKKALGPRPRNIELERRLANMSIEQLEMEIPKAKSEVKTAKTKMNAYRLEMGLQEI